MTAHAADPGPRLSIRRNPVRLLCSAAPWSSAGYLAGYLAISRRVVRHPLAWGGVASVALARRPGKPSPAASPAVPALSPAPPSSMMAVFSIFASLHVLELKMLGIGLPAAIAIDATIVRGILVLAAMAVLGDRCWYLPRWLCWLPGRRDRAPDPESRTTG